MVDNTIEQRNSSQIRDFTQGSIFRQLISLAMPLMAISFIQMTYNLVDIIWIGRLGSRSVAAVGSVGMIMWMMSSVALISKVGAEVSIGQSIGAKRMDRAMLYASHTTTIAAILGAFFLVLFVSIPHTFVSFFKLDADIAKDSINYLRIVALGLPFMFLVLNFSGIFVGSGRSDLPFYYNASGLLLNIILDPLLIFGWGPIKGMGVVGAALATTISQGLVAFLFIYNLKKKDGLFSGIPFFIKLHKSYTFDILKLGLPVALMNVYFAFINMNLVRIASIYGGYLGVTSQTTGGQIEGIMWNTSQGFSTALGSFVAQNFASRKMNRSRQAYKYTILMMGALGVVVTAAFVIFGEEIFSVFIPEKEAYIAGGEYLFIIGISQLFMMLELTTQGMFNGMGKTSPPAIISVTMNTIRIPLAILMATWMGVNGVWWALSITSIIKGIVSPAWFYIEQRKHR